jgi:hypothetical protein
MNVQLMKKELRKRISRIAFTILPVFCVLMLSLSCELKEDDVDPGEVALVSLFHTSPDGPNLDILVDNEKINNVPFEYGKNTGYLQFSPGNRNLKFRPYGGGAIGIDQTITLEPDEDFSVFVVDEYDQATVLSLWDNPDPPPAGYASVRFINLSPDSEPIQLKIKDVTIPLTVGQSFKDASQFMNVEAKSQDFQITSGGNVVLELPGSVLQDQWYYTIYVIGYVSPPTGNTNTLSAQVFIH